MTILTEITTEGRTLQLCAHTTNAKIWTGSDELEPGSFRLKMYLSLLRWPLVFVITNMFKRFYITCVVLSL